MNITFIRDEPVRVRAAVIADENAHGPSCRHVTLGVVLWPLRRHLPEDFLSEADETLAKRSAACSRPRGEPIFASDAGVEEERHMLQQPAAEWVPNWQPSSGSLLNAQPHRAEESADGSDPISVPPLAWLSYF